MFTDLSIQMILSCVTLFLHQSLKFLHPLRTFSSDVYNYGCPEDFEFNKHKWKLLGYDFWLSQAAEPDG